MNLKPIIQSEVSQKEKDIIYINIDYIYIYIYIHIYGIQKDGTNDPTCRAVKETQM